MPPSLRYSARRVGFLSLLLAIFLQASARAEVNVTGAPDSIKLEASNASLEELLTALSKTYGLQYRVPADRTRSVTGTFEGSLPYVLSRLLRSYNFVAETSSNGIRIVVYDFSAPHGNEVFTNSHDASGPRAGSPIQPSLRPKPARVLENDENLPGRGTGRGPRSARANVRH